LLVGDVVGLNGEIVLEINLKAHQTKGDHSRSVVLSGKMRAELRQYVVARFSVGTLKQINPEALALPLFATQMRDGFTANTACYHFFMLYRQVFSILLHAIFGLSQDWNSESSDKLAEPYIRSASRAGAKIPHSGEEEFPLRQDQSIFTADQSRATGSRGRCRSWS
jgi:hypothetical protein